MVFKGCCLKKKVLIIYYSFSQQTRLLVKSLAAGFQEGGVEVCFERLQPEESYPFPFKSNLSLAKAMIQTFFRRRLRIREPVESCFSDWDLVVLAGPTWSYQPSGPILDFFDRFGEKVCRGKRVFIVISCRSYWRLHYWLLKRKLKQYNCTEISPMIVEHPTPEPFRFIGLVLQLRGKMIRKENSWFRKHYPGYGHDKAQLEEAYAHGRRIAREIEEGV